MIPERPLGILDLGWKNAIVYGVASLSPHVHVSIDQISSPPLGSIPFEPSAASYHCHHRLDLDSGPRTHEVYLSTHSGYVETSTATASSNWLV